MSRRLGGNTGACMILKKSELTCQIGHSLTLSLWDYSHSFTLYICYNTHSNSPFMVIFFQFFLLFTAVVSFLSPPYWQALKYTYCFPPKRSRYDTKLYLVLRHHFWSWMWSSSLLPLLLGPLWPGLVVPVKV